MKLIIFALFVAVATARPSLLEGSSFDQHDHEHEHEHDHDSASPDYVKIIRDERTGPEDGSYSFDIETEDGIVRSESGSPLNIEENPTGQQGSVSFTFPNGENYDLKYVADEGGYQPESSWIPVAPEFPHEIPGYVQEQIRRAAEEDSTEPDTVDDLSFPIQ